MELFKKKTTQIIALVTIIGTHLENDFIDQINSKKKHPALNCDVPKSVKFSKFEKLGEEINKKVDLVVVAVISKGIKWASIELSKVMKSSERLNLLKGWSQAIRRTLIQ